VRKFRSRAHHATGKNIVNPPFLGTDTICTTTIDKIHPALTANNKKPTHLIDYENK